MERLTEKHYDGKGYFMKCSEACANDDEMCGGCPQLDKIIDRLAAYEDTGLAPEQVAAQRWIPVTERMPEDDLPKDSKVKQIKVLTSLKSDKGVITVRSQMRYKDTWCNEVRWRWKYSGSEITHWMPLPMPPEEV